MCVCVRACVRERMRACMRARARACVLGSKWMCILLNFMLQHVVAVLAFVRALGCENILIGRALTNFHYYYYVLKVVRKRSVLL